jgi:hypothetical protein
MEIGLGWNPRAEMSQDFSRREYLRIGTATAALGTLGSLAGCSSIPFVGGGGNYQAWLPEPGTISDRDDYSFTFLDSKTVVNNEDEFDSDTFDRVERLAAGYREQVDVDFDETNTILTFQSTAVVTGQYNTGDVTDELDRNDFDEEGDYKGTTVFLADDESMAVGVSGAALAFARPMGGEDADEIVELMIDTRRGDEDRYVEENEDLQTALDAVGNGTAVGGTTSPGLGSDIVGIGSSLQVNGSTSNLDISLVFDDESDADTDEGSVERFVEFLENNSDLDDVETQKDGRTILVTGTIDTDELGTDLLAGVGG